jgi:hypothetical protein
MSAGSIGQSIINGTYGLDNRPPTAYEELKAWCEKWNVPIAYSDSRQIAVECSTEKCIGVNFVFDVNGTLQKTSLDIE